MKIDKTADGEKTVFSLSGRLDTTTAQQLQQVLIPEFDSSKHVRLDFKQLAYVSSAGLRVLLMGVKTAKAKSGLFTLVNVSEEIKEVFDMTGFTPVLNIVEL